MDHRLIPLSAGGTPQPGEPSPPLTVSPGAAGGLPTSTDVAKMVAATSVKKRKRAGTHLIQTSFAPAPAPALASKPKRKRVSQKRPARRSSLLPATPSPPPAVSPTVTPSPPPAISPTPHPFDPLPKSTPAHGSFMEMLNGTIVDTSDPPLAPFGGEQKENLGGVDADEPADDEETDDEEMVEVTEVETKRDVKLPKVETTREEARRKAELEEMKIKVKKEKAMKALLAEEREIMMKNTKDMNERQLEWWKETTAEITERRRLLRQSETGGASVEHGDNSEA